MLLLLNQLERKYGSTIDLDGDYYWDVTPDVAFDPWTDAAQGLVAGQLTDDVESLQELLQRPNDEVPMVWHDLAHLVGILRRMAHLDQ